MTDDTLQPEADEVTEKPESAPGEELEGEDPPDESGETEVETEDKDPERFSKRYNKLFAERMEEKRRADALEAELNDAKRHLPKEQRPAVPDLPDPYDADYQEKMGEYTQAVAKATEWDVRKQAQAEQQQHAAQQAQARQQQDLVTKAQSYTERAKTLGIKPQELQAAGQAVAQFGISDDLTSFILENEQGPRITTFLARNPDELDKLVKMSPIQAAVRIATVLQAKVSKASGISGAPEPAESLSGGGAPPTQRGPKGAKFE